MAVDSLTGHAWGAPDTPMSCRGENPPTTGDTDRLRLPITRALTLTALPALLLGVAAAGSTARPAADGTSAFEVARSDAPLDRPSARLANEPWILRAGRLVLHGSAFRGVVTVRTPAGPKRLLKFTSRSVDIGDLDLTTRPSGAIHLQSKPATTSTIRGDGLVTLYLEELSGTLTSLGGAPLPAVRSVTLTPDALPQWLFHAVAHPRTVSFDTVTVSQAGQFDGDLTIEGALFRAAGE
ncbi:hypothetical protein [Streptomyces sp. NPDC005181]|uniref:hypothetical protein n=1 Tax=Streptomyces sp. NPDC005181 TaxID=3156869 RepID=UPI00339E37A8